MKNTGFLKSRFFVAVVLFVALAAKVQAQNIQLHYDVRRNCVTSTVEMFRADNYGSTFFFIDMDYSPKASGAYGEISRELCFWKDSKLNWLSAHIEYNGGLSNTMSFDNACLWVQPTRVTQRTGARHGRYLQCTRQFLVTHR